MFKVLQFALMFAGALLLTKEVLFSIGSELAKLTFVSFMLVIGSWFMDWLDQPDPTERPGYH